MTREWQAHLALAILHQGDAVTAQKLLLESLRRSRDRENPLVLAQICTYLGEAALAQGEPDAAGDWLEQSLFYHGGARPINVDEVERLALAARVAAAQRDYDRAAILVGQVQAHSQRFDAAAAQWFDLQIAAAATKAKVDMKDERFAAAVAYGRELAAGGGINYAAVVVPGTP